MSCDRRVAEKATGLVLAILVMVVAAHIFPRVARPKDLYAQYLPAARRLVRGKSPYVEGFFNPPWVLIPFLPLVWMDDTLAASVYFCMSLVAWAYIAYRAKLSGWRAIAFLLSPPVVYSVAMGGIDWIPLLGLFLPSPWNWVLLITKPQMTIGYFIAAIKNRVLAYMVVGVLIVLCIVLGQVGPEQRLFVNVAVQPRVLALSVGLYLCYLLIERDRRLAPWIGPVLSPYLSVGNWAGLFLTISQHKVVLAVVLLGWILLISC